MLVLCVDLEVVADHAGKGLHGVQLGEPAKGGLEPADAIVQALQDGVMKA